MNRFAAFLKRHRRGIITTMAFLAFDVVMLLVVYPLIDNIENFNTLFFIVVPLAYVIYPVISLAVGIYAGRDLKRRWHIAVLQLLFFIECGGLIYIYIAIELLFLIITLIIMKCCKNKSDKQEKHNV